MLGEPDAGKNMLNMERFGFKRCGITKVDIKLGEVSIFDDGPLEWGSKASTPEEKMKEMHVNRHLFKMQKDFLGRQDNPLRHNSCVRRIEDYPLVKNGPGSVSIRRTRSTLQRRARHLHVG